MTQDARAKKAYRVKYERGYRAAIPAERARTHMESLCQQGMSRVAMVVLTGLSERSLTQIALGTRPRIMRSTEALILKLRAPDQDSLANTANIDSTATRRRVEALSALGYSNGWVAKRLGRRQPELDLGPMVTRKRALAVLDLCTEVGDTRGTCRRALLRAERNGWLTPAAYDDRFYNPHWDGLGVNDDDELAEAPSGPKVILEDYHFLRKLYPHTDDRSSDRLIAERIGCSWKYIERLLKQEAEAAA